MQQGAGLSGKPKHNDSMARLPRYLVKNLPQYVIERASGRELVFAGKGKGSGVVGRLFGAITHEAAKRFNE